MNSIKKFLKQEEGVTAIEYGVIAALIIVACITLITAVGTNLNATFQKIVDVL